MLSSWLLAGSLELVFFYTRSMHAYGASHRSKRHAWMGCAVQVSGIAHLVGVQRAIQNKGNVKSEPKYLACEESLVRAFYCWTFSCSLLALLGFHGGLTSWFYRVTSHQVRSALTSALDSAKYVCCEGPAVLFSLSSVAKKNVILTLCSAHVIWYPAWAWPQIDIHKRYIPQIDIPKHDGHIHTLWE